MAAPRAATPRATSVAIVRAGRVATLRAVLSRFTVQSLPVDPLRFAERVPSWLIPQGVDSDVVVSCRVRLARNVAGRPFVTKLSDERAAELAGELRPELVRLKLDGEMLWTSIAEAPVVWRLLLRERHLVSRDLAPSSEERPAQPGRAVAFSRSERLSVMINEEDHLRLQSMASGFQLEDAWERAKELDRVLEQAIPYAFADTYGYLTCCPTNVGTGLRASVMLHLPALAMAPSEIEKVFTAASRTGLAVRGLYGEGSRAIGDFYQISNQVTLGRSEEDLIGELHELVPAILKFERSVRAELHRTHKRAIEDRVRRSHGLLRTSRAMPTDGALAHLSNLRLGQVLGIFSEVPLDTLARLRVQIQKAHLQTLLKREVEADLLDPTERDRLRAEFLRKQFA
jgi:protein arginine kinase